LPKFSLMTDFNFAILGNYVALGYQYVIYHNLDHFAILVPCNQEIEMEDNTYTIPITDEQVFEMAFGVDEFSFYVFL